MNRPFLVAGTLAATAALAIPQAGATVTHRDHYSQTFAFSSEPCDIPLDTVLTLTGSLVVREDRDGAPRTKDTYAFEAVFTNPDNGNWFVQRGHGVVNQISATHVEGSVYEIVAASAGQPFVLEDAEGNVILRDRGQVRHTFLFDMETGETEDVSAVARGQYPASDASDEVCAAMAELAGV